jgi:hypothetical protein
LRRKFLGVPPLTMLINLEKTKKANTQFGFSISLLHGVQIADEFSQFGIR